MRWERLESLTADDPRWRVYVVDTTTANPAEAADDVLAWIAACRGQTASRPST
jgi:hypothetical protein